MSWFEEIARNPHIDMVLLVDSEGSVLAASQTASESANRVAAMLKAAEILARGLSAELGRGDLNVLQIATSNAHLIVTPTGDSYYVIVLTTKDAPLELITNYLHRTASRLFEQDVMAVVNEHTTSLDDVNVGELIDAVSDWLHSGGEIDYP